MKRCKSNKKYAVKLKKKLAKIIMDKKLKKEGHPSSSCEARGEGVLTSDVAR